ncbi:DMT family transporter [Microbacterium invictum]|uniref:Drug/metabolite transporter (DMT)-like permease n=1 Tax=Microbacterium invictum TaxID=515415 RepID=A0AA40SLK7_9MICO|nr:MULTISPECIES: EamA family transporter [Microbacterium]MBB4138427.1 drug/metabolite transporter (DMT)-like permease [Microbacterium invictum]
MAAVSGRAWLLYAAMAVLWGIPYLFIKEAVESYSPAAVVAGRTLLGAAILLPIAIHRRALRPALHLWPWVLAFGAIEMAGPFFLLSHAEQTIPSGITGLLVATVPLFAAIIALLRGDRSAFSPLRALGLLIGFGGVAVTVAGPGLAIGTDPAALFAVGEVLLTAVLYAIAPFIIATKLKDVPSMGTIGLALLVIGLVYLPLALATQHEIPTVRSTVSLVALGVLCTAVAFIGFFALIREVGPVRAPLFTYVNPIVAIGLGIVILGEQLTPGLLLGFPLVIVGCWLAATGGQLRRRPAPDMPAGVPPVA